MKFLISFLSLLIFISCSQVESAYNKLDYPSSYTSTNELNRIKSHGIDKLTDIKICKYRYGKLSHSDKYYVKAVQSEYDRRTETRSINCAKLISDNEKRIAEERKIQREKEAEKEKAHLAKLEKDYGFSCEWMSWLTRGTPEFDKCLKDKYYEEKYKKVAKSNSSSSYTSSISDPTIAKYQSECQQMGFKKKTDKMAECILRQKEIETRKVAAKKLYDEEVRKNKAAEELAAKKRRSEKMRQAGELLTGLSNSLLGSGSSNSYSSSSSSYQMKTPCMFKDEVQKNGSLTKLCLYDCTGSVHSETINVVQMCPLISYK